MDVADFFTLGDFVEVFLNGKWQDAVIQARIYKKGVNCKVCVLNEVKVAYVPHKDVRPSDKFKDELMAEFSEEMIDPTQGGDNPSIQVSQAPWDDREDFTNPKPMVAPAPKTPVQPVKTKKRFKVLSDAEIDQLQRDSKAANTHKHTRWGLKTLIGICHFFRKYLPGFIPPHY